MTAYGRNTETRRHDGQGGYVLLVVTVFAFVVLISSAAVVSTTSSEVKVARFQHDSPDRDQYDRAQRDRNRLGKARQVVDKHRGGDNGPGTAGSFAEEVDYTRLTEVTGLYRQYATFNLAIDALISDGHANLLSNSKVVTINGETAEIFVGEMRDRVALTLKCVISQVLLPHLSDTGRVAAREILFVTSPVANQIREGKVHMINNVISSSSGDGMCLLDDSLLEFYRDGQVDAASIMPRFQDPENARQVVSKR